MQSRLLVTILLVCSLNAAHASEEGAPAEKKPGMVSRFMNIFRGGKGEDTKSARVNGKRLVLTMSIQPEPVKLSEARQMKVTLQLLNRSSKLLQLDFPTTQRIEVLVRKPDGKMVEQWSEDQAFANEPTLVAVNPGERLEYTVPISTRDLVAGQSYTVEGFFPNYEQLKASKTITPEK
ncbi:MAG TPA: BsuPI-related putative proteinase inhibitor [Chthoniobacteraceae bacterium]|jgi:hypothetical protein